jgi:hypothetical protein
MAKELLNSPDVVAVFQQMGRKGVAQRMRRGSLRDAGSPNGILHGALQNGLVEMVALP